jgi:ribonuclease H2 subunit C
LQGKAVKLPEGYRGVVAATSAAQDASSNVVDVDSETPQGSLKTQAEFDEIVVWAHETAVDAAADPYMRGTEEWIALAEKVRRHALAQFPISSCRACLLLTLCNKIHSFQK